MELGLGHRAVGVEPGHVLDTGCLGEHQLEDSADRDRLNRPVRTGTLESMDERLAVYAIVG
jgi:hypothetical protein